jgi:hypothetical protein
MVRYEDTIFHAEEVFQTIADCVGMERSHPTFQRVVESAKSQEQLSIDLLTALHKNGIEKDRYWRMIAEDIEYAEAHLDHDLMDMFHYIHPRGVPADSYAAIDWLKRPGLQPGSP